MSTLIASTLQSIDQTTATNIKTGNTAAGLITIPSTGGIVLASNSTTNAVTVSATGNVVAGNIRTTGSLTIGIGGDYTNGSIYSDANWGMLFRAKVPGAAGSDFAWHNSADGEWARIGNTGNFGIGNTAPAQKLVVEGNMYANGVPLQMTYLRYDTKTGYSIPTAGTTGTIITDLNTSITPRRTTSKVLITYCIAYEISENFIFKLYRNNGGSNTEIGTNSTDANYWSGLWLCGYDADTNSTPRTQTMMYLDSPATTNTCTYQLMVQSSGSGASTFYLNRAFSSAGQSVYEVAISQVFLQEIGVV